MANILILGAGTMGTAFSIPCSDNNHKIFIVGTHLENKFVDQVNFKKKHPILNCTIPRNVKFVKLNKLKTIANGKIDLIAIAVVSKGIEWASKELSKIIKKNTPILILTKGLDIYKNKFEVMPHKMERILKKNGIKKTNISIAGGPCLAKNLSSKINTSVIFANKDIKSVKKISKLVSTNYYHISYSRDVVGVGLCSAIKNIFSMAIGSSVTHLNASAGIFQQSINEMLILIKKLKGKKETVMGLAGVGDLYVSAVGGRNSKMGEYLGRGMTFTQVKKIKMAKDTVEGADLALKIGHKIKKDFDNNKIPIMTSMINSICKNSILKIDWKKF